MKIITHYFTALFRNYTDILEQICKLLQINTIQKLIIHNLFFAISSKCLHFTLFLCY